MAGFIGAENLLEAPPNLRIGPTRPMSDDKPQKTDRYRDTVFLPRTSFAMKAGLPQKEPELLKRWERMDLYGTLRQQSAGRPRYVLHDGPPYANGHLHIGHALNKI